MEGDGREDDEAVDGDGGAQEVDELHSGDAVVEQVAVLVAVVGDGVQGTTFGGVEGVAADIVDELGGPAVELAAGDPAAPVAWPDARAAVDEVVELRGALPDVFVGEGYASPNRRPLGTGSWRLRRKARPARWRSASR